MPVVNIKAQALCNGEIVFNNDAIFGKTHKLRINESGLGEVVDWDVPNTNYPISFIIPENVTVTSENIGLSTDVYYIKYEEIEYAVLACKNLSSDDLLVNDSDERMYLYKEDKIDPKEYTMKTEAQIIENLTKGGTDTFSFFKNIDRAIKAYQQKTDSTIKELQELTSDVNEGYLMKKINDLKILLTAGEEEVSKLKSEMRSLKEMKDMIEEQNISLRCNNKIWREKWFRLTDELSSTVFKMTPSYPHSNKPHYGQLNNVHEQLVGGKPIELPRWNMCVNQIGGKSGGP